MLFLNQGAIAKFGTVPISDIAAYFELRNSKVTNIFCDYFSFDDGFRI